MKLRCMSHKHDSDCGHDDATHKRIKDKMEKFMEDVAEDMFSERDLANLYTVIISQLRSCNVGTSLPYMKAFNAGFEFGTYAASQSENSMTLIAGMKRINKLKGEEIKALAAKALEDQDDNEG